jgi:hypothetical protein
MNDYNVNHFRFARTLDNPHSVELYTPKSKFRWALIIAVACLLLLGLAQAAR